MTMLILKYERRDFFNNRIYTEDKKQGYSRNDLKRALAFLNKTYDAALQIDNMVIYWDSLADYENKVATVKQYDGMNYAESKKSYDIAKKECYAIIG